MQKHLGYFRKGLIVLPIMCTIGILDNSGNEMELSLIIISCIFAYTATFFVKLPNDEV